MSIFENNPFKETVASVKEDLFPAQNESFVRRMSDRFGKGFSFFSALIVGFISFVILWGIFGSIYKAATGKSMFVGGSSGIITFLAFIISILVFMLLYMWMHKKLKESEGPDGIKVSKNGTFGRAHFTSEEELKEICKITKPGDAEGVIVGKIGEKAVWIPKFTETPLGKMPTMKNDNIFILGNPGSGKSFSIIKPYLIQTIKKGDSFVTHDPSGEAYRDLCALCEANGYDTKVVNCKNFSASDGWDIVGEVAKGSDTQACTERATDLARAIWLNTQDKLAKPNQFWDDNGTNLLLFLLLYVALTPEPYYKGTRDIAGLIDVLEHINDKTSDGKGFEYDNKMEALARVSGNEDPCLRPYSTLMAGGQQRMQIPSSLSVKLSRIATNAAVKNMLSSRDIDLSTVSTKKTALFLVTNEMSDAFDFVASCFVTCLIAALAERWFRNKDEDGNNFLDIPVHFVLDELIALGYIPNYGRIFANTRKYFMPQIIVVQDIQLFETQYKDTWGSLVGSCALTIFLSSSQADQKTTEYVSKILGTQTIVTETLRRSGFGIEAFSFDMTPQEMSSENKRALLNPEEVGQLPPNQLLVLFTGPNVGVADPCAAKIDKFPVTDLPAWDFCKAHKTQPTEHVPARGFFKSAYYEKIEKEVLSKAQGREAESASEPSFAGSGSGEPETGSAASAAMFEPPKEPERSSFDDVLSGADDEPAAAPSFAASGTAGAFLSNAEKEQADEDYFKELSRNLLKQQEEEAEKPAPGEAAPAEPRAAILEDVTDDEEDLSSLDSPDEEPVEREDDDAFDTALFADFTKEMSEEDW